MINPLYSERSQAFTASANQLGKTANRWSVFRSLFFLGAIALTIFLAQLHWSLAVITSLLALVAFFWMIKKHQAFQVAAMLNQRLALINEQEIAALKNDFTAFDPGTRYQDPLHPYTSDLDFFGKNSIYQFCCRTVTSSGGDDLAGFFSAPAAVPTIIERQLAIDELSKQLDWRQHFRAQGLENPDQAQLQAKLKLWVTQQPAVFGNQWVYRLLLFLPLWNIASVGYAATVYPWYVSVLCLLPTIYLLRRYFVAVNQLIAQTSKAQNWLDPYAKLILAIETAEWESPLLARLQKEFLASQGSASDAIRQLSYCLSQLNVRNNPFAILLNLFGLWDIQWLYRLESWKITWRDRLPLWLNVLGELDAFSSLANVRYNYPDWVFPEVQATHLDEPSPAIATEALGHPLIPADRRIGNDLTMPSAQHLKLLTGSNMAGKSTFLRTLGVNLVLAQTGAPVCAKRLEMPPLLVFTGMRTHDDLSENASSFYAELKRLRALLDAVETAQHQGPQVFFLLDEILKGTNSRDRHSGSRGLILQLLQNQGAGFIATHDLELAVMEKEYPALIENCCMEVEIEGGQLFFDYKLKKGVSQSFNATVLMQQMGIGVSDAVL